MTKLTTEELRGAPRGRCDNPQMCMAGKGSQMTAKQICSFVANAMCCRSCGEVFNSVDHPHVDEECAKGRASWEAADQEMIAARLYRMMTWH